jgi:hypothetical protein
MQTTSRRISLTDGKSFCWPVKIRVRAETPTTAPRESPRFPASSPHYPQSAAVVLRVLEIPPRPVRRLSLGAEVELLSYGLGGANG